MKKPTIVTLSDREVVRYAIGEIVGFVLLRLAFLALLGAGAWWVWGRIGPFVRGVWEGFF